MLIGIDASRATMPQRTGTENYTLYLVRALLDLDRTNRYRLYFNTPPAANLFERSERVEWRVMPFPRLWTHARLAWDVLRHPPDVLFVPAHVVPLVSRAHCVVTVHDLGYRYYPQAHTWSSRTYLELSTRWNAWVGRRVIADSEATRRDLITFYGLDPARIVVAYPAGAQGMAPVTDERLLAEVQERYHTGPRCFLYVGTLQPRKNLVTLVRAFAALVRSGVLDPEVRLVLGGKQGWLPEELASALAEADMGKRIVLPGYVPDADLAALLSGALAFVLPSWYEGFGLLVLEAMACGTPVICSNASSLPEVAGDAALLFDPYDMGALERAMQRVYQDSDLRRALRLRGSERAMAFGWDRCAKQVLAVLQQVGSGA
jgi:glycosyltransferase involved in cell wall biosynthesis